MTFFISVSVDQESKSGLVGFLPTVSWAFSHSEGLTEARRFASKNAHWYGCWQDTSLPYGLVYTAAQVSSQYGSWLSPEQVIRERKRPRRKPLSHLLLNLQSHIWPLPFYCIVYEVLVKSSPHSSGGELSSTSWMEKYQRICGHIWKWYTDTLTFFTHWKHFPGCPITWFIECCLTVIWHLYVVFTVHLFHKACQLCVCFRKPFITPKVIKIFSCIFF